MNPANSGQVSRARSRSRSRQRSGSAGDADSAFGRTASPSRPGLFAQVSQADEVHEASHDNDDVSSNRPRSGSWTGINESDDELERIANVMKQPPPEIKISSASNGCSHYGSVASSVTSINNQREFEGSVETSSTTGMFSNSLSEDRMRRRLKFFFMNPMEKWSARRRFPWKLLLQLVKVVVVTAQLCLFAQQRYNHVNYLWDTKISFSHLFIKGWDTTREIQVYPPADGPLAVYTKNEFYDYLDYAVTSHAKIRDMALGSYIYDQVNGTILDPDLCMTHYVSGVAFPNNTYVLNGNISKECIKVPIKLVNSTEKWSTKEFLSDNNITINFDLLLGLKFTFSLRTIKLRVSLPFDVPECYRLIGTVIFNNHDHDGQMLVDLDVGARVLECEGDVSLNKDSDMLKVWRTIINVLSIAICVASLCMCVRAIYRAQVLKNTTVMFFEQHFGKLLSFDERLEFLNLWYVLICINDVFIIFGSIIKIGLESKSYEGYLDTWNVCSLLLGLGNLLIWFGCLRYLGFFETYNVLILTMKKSFPNVLRYTICVLMVFAGYCFCGWLVLGPYHLKFRSLSSTMECLYSLINGDDMFATFSSTSGKDPVVWWFSRIYLYTFISLFIYVILSLFIAIIMDAYETIKKYYEEGFPITELAHFINQCHEEPSSGAFHDEHDRTIHDVVNSFCCCCYNRDGGDRSDYEPIIT